MQVTDARLDSAGFHGRDVAGTVAKKADEIESHERRLERLEGDAD